MIKHLTRWTLFCFRHVTACDTALQKKTPHLVTLTLQKATGQAGSWSNLYVTQKTLYLGDVYTEKE